jgi:hypothetical protein
MKTTIQSNTIYPDLPSRHHLPFDRPFDKLTVLSEVEGLMALCKPEGLRCLRSLLPPPARGQACGVLLYTPQSSLLGAPASSGISQSSTYRTNTLLVIRNTAYPADFSGDS